MFLWELGNRRPKENTASNTTASVSTSTPAPATADNAVGDMIPQTPPGLSEADTPPLRPHDPPGLSEADRPPLRPHDPRPDMPSLPNAIVEIDLCDDDDNDEGS